MLLTASASHKPLEVRAMKSIDLTCAKGRFIVVAGIDGCGKSTLLSRVHIHGLVSCSWCDLRDFETLRPLAPRCPTGVKQGLPSLSRAMFVGGHLVGQYEYLVRPRLAEGWNVVLDSYYYKAIAKEELYGVCHRSLRELCWELPEPDCVIFVDVDPATSYARKKGRLSPYEYFSVPSAHDYIDFQSRLRDKILERIAGVPTVYRVDGEEEPGQLLLRVEELLRSHLRSTGGIECNGDRQT
jgi:thymidylate kinase